MVFDKQKVIVELDGWQFHGDHDSFKADRERDTEALKRGWATVRVTWERLFEARQREAERLYEILEQRGEPRPYGLLPEL